MAFYVLGGDQISKGVISVRLVDNSDQVIKARDEQIEAALKAVGIQCQGYAQDIITKKTPRRKDSWYTSKGAAGLKGSINHQVFAGEKAVYVGTNNNHAVYNEVGTGKYADDGKGRKGWWVFVPGSSEHKKSNSGRIYTEAEARRIVAILRSQGLDAHMTQGISALHFIRDAAADHLGEYKEIIKKYLKD